MFLHLETQRLCTTTMDENAYSAGQLLVESRETYSSVMSLFQQIHDLILRSGLFVTSSSFMTSLDQSALSFHSLGLHIVSLASKISDQWIDEVLSFYKNLSKNAPRRNTSQLEFLGGQTKIQGHLFRVIVEWLRDLAGRVHSANEDYKKEHFAALSETAGRSSSMEVSIVALTATATGTLAAAEASQSEEEAQKRVDDSLEALKFSFDAQSVAGKQQVCFIVCLLLVIFIKYISFSAHR